MENKSYCDITGKIHRSTILLISQTRPTILDKKVSIRVTNATESPLTIRKETHIAELSRVTPKKPNFIKPVNTASVSMIPGGYQDLTTYLSELFRTSRAEQQSNTFWFPSCENPVETEYQIPVQERTLNELNEKKTEPHRQR